MERSAGSAVREDPDGGGRGAAGGRLAPESLGGEFLRAKASYLCSLLLIVDLDRSTIS